MKRIVLLIIAALTLGFAAEAQSTFSKGTTTLNMGLGIGGSISNSSYSMLIPPIALGLDHSMVSGLFDGNGSVGLGGYLGTELFRIKGYDRALWSHTVLGPRGSLHYQFVDKLDTYFSVMLGMKIISWDYKVSAGGLGVQGKDTDVSFDWGLQVGTRYYFSDHWAMMGELGYGFTYFSLGATYRF